MWNLIIPLQFIDIKYTVFTQGSLTSNHWYCKCLLLVNLVSTITTDSNLQSQNLSHLCLGNIKGAISFAISMDVCEQYSERDSW